MIALLPLLDRLGYHPPKVQFQVEPPLFPPVPQCDGVGGLSQFIDEIIEARALDLKFWFHDCPFHPNED